MSIPGWSDPQRMPNGLVIGPETGQIRAMPPFGACAAGVPDPAEPPDSAALFAAARNRAARVALAAASAWDSLIESCSACFVAAQLFALPGARAREPALARAELCDEDRLLLRARIDHARLSAARPVSRHSSRYARPFTWRFELATSGCDVLVLRERSR